MTEGPAILAFAGSTRRASFNKKLVRIAAAGAEAAGARVTLLDLHDLPLPLYDGDDEERDGLPDNARALKAAMTAHHGFLIAAPEYNSSITGVLKNAIDWASRPVDGESSNACFRGKVIGLMSASPGGFGGMRGIYHTRAILMNIGAIVLPEFHSVPRAYEAFDESGQLKDPEADAKVRGIGQTVTEVCSRMRQA